MANSDMDCMGVCFGNYTEYCEIEIEADSKTIDIPLSVNNGSAVSTILIENKSNGNRKR